MVNFEALCNVEKFIATKTFKKSSIFSNSKFLKSLLYKQTIDELVIGRNTLNMKSSQLRLFLVFYFSSVILGWLVLQLPFSQKSLIHGVDVFFTVASAISTTGLTTIDIGQTFSFFGQIVLLLLIQLGGIGFMMLNSFVFLIFLQKDSQNRKNHISHMTWNLSFKDLFAQIIKYTLISEILGLITLYFFFKSNGEEMPLWNAIFHSVSAFCTAGFSLLPSNLESYRGHFGINTIISFLTLLGAFGFFPWLDLKRLKDRLFHRLAGSFSTLAILIGSFLFLILMPHIAESSLSLRIIISYFQVVSAITTAGFNTIDIKSLSQFSHFFLIILMLIGISLTANGTNLKGTSFIGLLKRVVHHEKTNPIRRQKIVLERFQMVMWTFYHYCIVLIFAGLLFFLIEKQQLLPIFFETASALCTVGLSTGITPELSSLGKSFMALFMLTGRVGILIYGFSISSKGLSLRKKGLQETPV